jgi:AcrR family transcriptional regulator
MAETRVESTPDRSRRRRRGGADDPSGREQIIEDAIASILEVGFYRSSTNEIARRARVSWGALQYHFGTREALLLAIVEELARRFLESVDAARVEGETLAERIASLYAILAAHYENPTFLVRLQIVLNLQHDPDTSDEVMTAIAEQSAASEAGTRRLLVEALGPDADPDDYRALFHALRGMALSRLYSETVPVPGSTGPSRAALERFVARLADGWPDGSRATQEES